MNDIFYAFAPHNVSRIVWSGIGLVMRGQSGKYKLALSERAEFLEEELGSGSLNHRALVNTRDEPHADATHWRRYHDVSGETTMNPYVTALRLAAGSILLRACELNVDFKDLMPADPLKAMRQISYDTSLTRSIPLVSGRRVTALDLQEAIATRAIYYAEKAGYLTLQEQLWGERWLSLIDDLRRDPDSCFSKVEWVYKRSLIEKQLMRSPREKVSDFDVAWKVVAAYHSVLPSGLAIRAMERRLYPLSPTREELYTGVPLPNTRARLRAKAIDYLKKTNRDYTVDWDFIRLNDRQRTVRLGDPSATESENLDRLLVSL